MNNRFSILTPFRHRLSLLSGISLVFFSVFYFSGVSAKTEITENSAAQNLTLGKLAFLSSTGSFGNPAVRIYTANPDGTGWSGVVGGDFPVYDPSWSPDGTKIVYSFAGLDIYVINPDGSNRINLTNSAMVSGKRNPSWSVTGKIAYQRADQIWVVNSDGTNNMQFPITQPTPKFPKWSPNGRKLAFVSNSDIWTVNADGTDAQRITTNSTTNDGPAWSPDGTKLIFGKIGIGIAVINADGTNETILTNNPNDIQPNWSPDGTTIAFNRNSPVVNVTTTDGGIYTMSASGANQVRIIADTAGTLSNYRKITNPNWQSFATPQRGQFDFDGDSRSDISVFRPDNGIWYLSNSGGGFSGAQWGISTDVLAPADYDGDQKTDVAVWRASEGNFYILNSSNGTVRVDKLGMLNDVPIAGDFDGDGKADPALYRPGTQGLFFYRGSLNNPNGSIITSFPLGNPGDKPVGGDYDGDGRTDLAVYRNGDWYVRQSSTTQIYSVNFGLANDKVVPADYDGDGKTDFAVYRDGIWYVSGSSQGFTAFQFGIAGDIPAPADYDGDGRADAAIYRDGVWWILKSQTSAVEALQFGLSNDKPIASAFVR